MKRLLSLLLMATLLALSACASRETTPAQPTATRTAALASTPAPTATRRVVTATASPTRLPIPTAITPARATATPAPQPLGPDSVQRLTETGRATVPGPFPIGDLAWTPDGRFLVVAYTEGKESALHWYDANTLKPAVPPTKVPASHLAFSADGKWVAVATSGLGQDHLEIRRADDWSVHQTVEGFFYGIHALAFSPHGRLLAMANGNARVRLVEVKSGLVLYELKVPYQGSHAPLVQDVAFSPDGNLVAGAAYGGTVQVWQTVDGRAVTTVWTGTTQPNVVVFLDTRRFVTTGFPLAQVWRSDGTLETKLDGRDEPLDLALSPDGRLLATVEQFQVLFWDVAGRRTVHRIESEEPLRALQFSPDGTRLAVLKGDDKTMLIWEAGIARAIKEKK